MSTKIKEFLALNGILTTHEERVEIDREIERRTGKFCDDGFDELSHNEMMEIINNIKKKKKKMVEQVAAG